MDQRHKAQNTRPFQSIAAEALKCRLCYRVNMLMRHYELIVSMTLIQIFNVHIYMFIKLAALLRGQVRQQCFITEAP